MKKKTLLMMSGVLALAITPLLLLPLIQNSPIYSIKGNNAPYYLRINNTTNKYSSGGTYVVKTDRGSDISFTASNLSSHADYAFTMDNGAYLYNTTVINGLMSMQMVFDGAVDVYFGDEANPSASHATLTSGGTFNFHGDYPSYIKFQATASTNVESIVLIYDCVPLLQNLEFTFLGDSYLVEPNNYVLETCQTFNIPSNYKGYPVTVMHGFETCNAVKDIYIGDNIETIENQLCEVDYLFGNGGSVLEAFHVSEENQYFSSIDGVLFDKDGTTLYRYPANKEGTSYTVSFPTSSQYNTINTKAFQSAKNLTTINTGNAIFINENAFNGMPNLEQVTISATTNNIADEVFSDCSNLIEVVIVPTVATAFNLSLNAFDNATALETITVQSGNEFYKSIDGMLCSLDNKLLRCPEGRTFTNDAYKVHKDITGIGSEAFKNCQYLNKITIPDAGFDVLPSSFDSAWSLECIEVNGNSEVPVYSSVDGVLYNDDKTELIRFPIAKGFGEDDYEYEILSSVTALRSRSFAYTLYLADLTIPACVVSIGASSFDDDEYDPLCCDLTIHYGGTSETWSVFEYLGYRADNATMYFDGE